MAIVPATFEAHAPGILEIMNQAILETTSTYDYKAKDLAELQAWFDLKAQGGWPVLVAVENGRVAGYATYGTFRTKPAYKYTVEHSVYVHPDFHRRGLGRTLLRAIIGEADACGVRVMVGCIDAANTASIQLHVTEGFELSGVVRQAGYKFGRWLDAAFYQRILSGPETPNEE
ncbi:GNAT family N-acetyltransferase [Nibricoccus sp. IMCC34717]|uniref:GNAT family N-acetyltransferase n=1 Tax=Nibricoccus sp. IMCC34717 TaxID=3034021 RepID=UPI00384CBF80